MNAWIGGGGGPDRFSDSIESIRDRIETWRPVKCVVTRSTSCFRRYISSIFFCVCLWTSVAGLWLNGGVEEKERTSHAPSPLPNSAAWHKRHIRMMNAETDQVFVCKWYTVNHSGTRVLFCALAIRLPILMLLHSLLPACRRPPPMQSELK